MWYQNNKEEWIERGKPNAQIEKSTIDGKYTVWLYHLISSSGVETITNGALVFNYDRYQPGVGGSIPPAIFDTEQDAMDAFNDYRRRNPIDIPKKSEVIKTIFE